MCAQRQGVRPDRRVPRVGCLAANPYLFPTCAGVCERTQRPQALYWRVLHWVSWSNNNNNNKFLAPAPTYLEIIIQRKK